MNQLVAVRLLTSGPNKNLPKGRVVEVDSLRAAALIKANAAEEVKS